MTTPRFTREQIFEGVREDVADCLALELEEVSPEANFHHDLGGESIEILDLTFRFEKRFGFRSPLTRLTDPKRWSVDAAGRPTDEMLCWLQAEFPVVDWVNHLEKTSLDDPLSLFTINLLVDLLFDAQHHTAPDVQISDSTVAT